MTFLGFRISNNGDLLDPVTNSVLEKRLMDPTLRQQLKVQGVDFDANYEERDRLAKYNMICYCISFVSTKFYIQCIGELFCLFVIQDSR